MTSKIADETTAQRDKNRKINKGSTSSKNAFGLISDDFKTGMFWNEKKIKKIDYFVSKYIFLSNPVKILEVLNPNSLRLI